MSHPSPRRLPTVALLATLLVLVSAGPVAAKMPYFSVEVSPAQPLAGVPFEVVVRTWNDAEHTQPAAWDLPIDGVLVLRRAEDADVRFGSIPVPLRLVTADEYRATVEIAEAGDWVLVAFPDRSGWSTSVVPEGYPDRIPIRVATPQERLAPEIALSIVAGIPIALGILAEVWRMVSTTADRS
jgi:hypothetical protein